MAGPAEKVMTVNVVGLGYVGVEICLAAIAAGCRVAAVDNDERRLRELRRPAQDESFDDWAAIRGAIARGEVELHADARTAPVADAWVVAVPTPLDEDGRPDTRSVRAAAHAIAPVAAANAVVVLESTSYPGTTEEVFLPAFLAAGWTPGVDLFVGFSPERINPGSREWTMKNIPKLVSGCTDECLKAVTEFYRVLVDDVRPVSSTRAAEMAKLYENSWRLVNIAFANEHENLCLALGIDPWEVSQACRTKPFGYFGFDPGPGAGGHCIPVDAGYLADCARAVGVGTPVLDSAITANLDRPGVVVRRIVRELPDDRPGRVLVIGVAYKENVADIREAPAIAVLRQLEALEVEVDYHDPHVPRLLVNGRTLESAPLTAADLATYDCVAVLTAHDAVDWTLLAERDGPVVDTRNVSTTAGGDR